MKNKVFSFINIFGLAVGLSCCLLITIYIVNELSYDTHHIKKEKVFQLGTSFVEDDEDKKAANTSAPLGALMKQEFPEIEQTSRLMKLWRDDKTLFQYNDEGGNTKTALNEPASVVLSEEIAEKIFGNQPALGKVIRISSSTNGDHDYKVTGVYKEPHSPSHIDARFILSFRGGNMDEFANENTSLLNNNMFYTYVLLKDGADGKSLQNKFPAFIDRHMGAELKAVGKQRKHFLTPIQDVYLRSGIEENVTAGGSQTSLFILASIALLTLLIACINFMNLSTSSSSKRAAEVGVRKVLGAEKSSLLKQFLGESVLMALIALVFAFIFTVILRPFFEQVAGKELQVSIALQLQLAGAFVILAIVTGLLAGIYPAFYLSSFKPIRVLKGKFTNSLAAVSLRKGMVVFQFIISIALIVASVVIASQMKYMQKKNLGFQKDQQVIIPLRTSTAKASISAFKNEAGNVPGVRSIGASMYYPGIFNSQDWLMYKQGQSMDQSKTVYINLVDVDLLQTLDVKPVAGRIFSRDYPADTLTRFVVNEEAVKKFGFASPEDAVGKWLAFDWEGEQHAFTIIGVVKNFHFKDLKATIEPFAFRMYPSVNFNYMIAHANGNMQQTLSSFENIWKKLNPNEPFEYSFLDLDFQKNYEAERRQAGLINYFTIIAILISCLGLFALAVFSAEQRTKEIGIRKVLGASVGSVVALLSKDFLKLVLIAVVIASPIAWYFMNKWLQNFAYRTTITWQVFVLTALLALTIAFITISFQSIRAALANPVKNLRSE
jgi:putative ABC transport system permease protein